MMGCQAAPAQLFKAVEWSKAPQGTKSFVVIVDDPDATKPKPFTHWLAYDIPVATNFARVSRARPFCRSRKT